VFVGLLALARAPVELAEDEVAVGGKGTHLHLLGERECALEVLNSTDNRYFFSVSLSHRPASGE
jgi:hypothetical protein